MTRLKNLLIFYKGSGKKITEILKFNNNLICKIDILSIDDYDDKLLLFKNLINLSKSKHILKSIEITYHQDKNVQTTEFDELNRIAREMSELTFPHEAFKQGFNVNKLEDCIILHD